MELFGLVKILSASDYIACSHRRLQGDYTVFAIGEWKNLQFTHPADYIKTRHVTIEWE